MSKHASNVVKAAGFLATFNHRLFAEIEKAGISDERFYELLKADDADFMAKIISVFVESAGMTAGKLAELISDCKLHHVDPDINVRNLKLAAPFTDAPDMTTVSQKELSKLQMSTAEILAAVSQIGFRPATLVELLIYGKTTWDRQDSIVALGTHWMKHAGQKKVPYLFLGGNGPKLILRFYGEVDRWHWDDLFLVVRKET
jgi:hypothetical protein